MKILSQKKNPKISRFDIIVDKELNIGKKLSANMETLEPLVGSVQGFVKNPLEKGGDAMKECNICGRELLEDVLVVDTSLDMKPIKFKDVHGDKSDLICIECAIDSIENPPFVCSRCGQPIEFNEKFYVFREATAKPGGPKVDFKETCLDDKYICRTCFSEVMSPEGGEERA